LPQASDSDVSHEVCCVDESISMCGLSLPEEEIGEGEPSCVVCLDLLERWAHYADLYGEDPKLPTDPPCRLCPRLNREGDQ
jgi:hypothetical protein